MLSWNWETDMRQCLQMEVFWLCKTQCPPVCPCPLPCVYMKTLPIYLNCVRCCVAKIFLNQRIHPVRVSVLSIYLSIYLVCPSVSSSCLLLQTKCAGINPLQEPNEASVQPKLKSSMLECPIDPCSVYKRKSFSRPKKKKEVTIQARRILL